MGTCLQNKQANEIMRGEGKEGGKAGRRKGGMEGGRKKERKEGPMDGRTMTMGEKYKN